MEKERKRRLVIDPLEDHMGKQAWWAKEVVTSTEKSLC